MEGSGKSFQVDGTSAHVWSVVRIEEERALQVKETKRSKGSGLAVHIGKRVSPAWHTSVEADEGEMGWWQAGSWIVYCSRNQFMEVGKREPRGLDEYNGDT